MNVREFIPLIATVAIVFLSSGAYAAPSCEITAEKKEFINTLLCGQNSPDVAYRFFGPGCVKKSTSIRMDDSVIQVIGYRLCGDEMFAARLLEAHKKANEFMKVLAPCTSESIDVDSIWNESTRKIEEKFVGHSCNASMRNSLEQRRPYFQQQIDQSEQSDQSQIIFEKLSIRVDGEGNIFDK